VTKMVLGVGRKGQRKIIIIFFSEYVQKKVIVKNVWSAVDGKSLCTHW
jgi:hypothetical protein